MIDAVIYRPLMITFSSIRGVVKFTVFFLAVMEYILHHELAKLVLWNKDDRYRYYLKSARLHSKFGLWLLDIKVSDLTEQTPVHGLLICNHLSYLDVLVLFSRHPALFITSQEISETFLLGRMTRLAGCFHVERRKNLRTNELIQKELSAMKAKLSQGFSLFLFPEGTSSDGTTVLPFKAHFFQTAIDLEIPIHAFTLKYKNADEACWFGDMSFAPHLFKMCCREEIKATLISVDYDRGGETDRFKVAADLQARIKDTYENH
jgi:lyso-ornithine lipid O-acyltransferase